MSTRGQASAELECADKSITRAGWVSWVHALSLCLLASSYFVPCHHHEVHCDLSHSRAVAWSHAAHCIGKGRAETQLLKMAASAFLPQRVHADIPAIVEEGPALLQIVAAAPQGPPRLQ